ncbi:nucleotide-diphospho-sugar transferases superfamily protein [Actinidia rufa]|uniref:Glycosyltransferases n=1 Tax=Actinidia rufa TaxID=165716 RepID=A0A7J0DSK1_9ERIC|nr:nucleotide-diphospho-sugar transferases superfamily protein [Actinidia rufa]
MVGAFLGLTPFASMSLSANLLSKHQAFSFEIFPPPEKVLLSDVRPRNVTLLVDSSALNDNTTLGMRETKLDLKNRTSDETLATQSVSEDVNTVFHKLLIIVTPTHDRPFQAYYMNRLAHTLRLIPPPLLWIVVDMGSQSAETADILRRNGGILYRHLVCYKNLTDIKDRGVHQRNAALSHIETHHLDGIVYFADDDNIYSVDLFEQMRKISLVKSVNNNFVDIDCLSVSGHWSSAENAVRMSMLKLWMDCSSNQNAAIKTCSCSRELLLDACSSTSVSAWIWHIHSKAETITMRNKGFSKVFQKNSIALVSENPSKAQIYGKGDLPKAIGQIILGNIINSLCFWIHKVYIPSSFLVWTIALAFPRRFGTWAVATLMESNRRAHIQGPSCNGTQVIGWHSNQVTRRFQRFHAEMSGFAFNSTILWDPKRWHRPTLEPIRQFDTLNGRFQASSFIEQVVEDESQMECLPQDYSRIVVWHLHFESSYSYPPEWVMKNNLDVIASLA